MLHNGQAVWDTQGQKPLKAAVDKQVFPEHRSTLQPAKQKPQSRPGTTYYSAVRVRLFFICVFVFKHTQKNDTMRRDPIVKLVGRKYEGVSNKLITLSATQVNMELRQISKEISPPELHYTEVAALNQIAE